MNSIKATNVLTGLDKFRGRTIEFVRTNPILSGSGAILGLSAGSLAITKIVSSRKKKSTTKKKKKITKKRKKARRKTTKSGRRLRYTPRTAGKGRDRSTRRIRMTKNGQPYVILKSGKARFIKKSSARRSRKLKGGRY